MAVTNFGDPVPDGALLWRYMKLSTFLLMLEGKAFFPSVATLQKGDQLEGDIILEDAELRLMGQLDALQSNRVFQWLTERANQPERWILTEPTTAQWRGKVLTEVYLRELAKRRAVWCWFLESHESAAMWSGYANAGVAIQTTAGDLQRALPGDLEFQMAKMNYFSRSPSSPRSLNPEHPGTTPLLLRPHLMKGEEYRHENEVRIVTSCLPDQRGGRLINLCKVASMIKEVIISPLLPHDERTAIRSLIDRHSVWSSNPPPVTASSMLGHKAEEQEMSARVEAMNHELWKHGEPELPPPFDTL